MANIRQDWDNDGYLVITDAKTIDRYKEITEQQRNGKYEGIFYAFNNEQFEEGYNKVKHLLKEGEKICSFGYGGYGVREYITKMFDFIKNADKMIAKECDPQEVYYYEYNNHECCVDWDGDKGAIKVIIDIFGADVARKIKRFRECCTIDDIIAERAKRRSKKSA